MQTTTTDVLIVGAGPTGLALATALQKARVDHRLVDALPGPQNSSRAAVVHAHTLEMLERLDVVAGMEIRGIKVSHFAVRDRDRALLDIAFDDLPSVFRELLMIPQSTTEALLHARLNELGGEIHRGVTAIKAEATTDGAQVKVQTATGEELIEARYVVGADGMHSVIRHAAGIAFHGEAFDESFVLADVRMEWPIDDEVSLFFSSEGLVVVAPLPDGAYRVVATLDNAPADPGIADIQHLLDRRGPTAPCRITSIGWASRFRVQHRLADSYRSGPFLLMGDAAHVHSPAGGQGMNTGLVDAVVLAEALTRVVRDREPDTLLDAYSRTRRAAAHEVLGAGLPSDAHGDHPLCDRPPDPQPDARHFQPFAAVQAQARARPVGGCPPSVQRPATQGRSARFRNWTPVQGATRGSKWLAGILLNAHKCDQAVTCACHFEGRLSAEETRSCSPPSRSCGMVWCRISGDLVADELSPW
jgi:2-polyprenyl-6-methoxyphenol hydroxylase-like FAD-dependent oxidoreductase